MEQCSETSAYKIQTPKNHPNERIRHSEEGGSFKSQTIVLSSPIYSFSKYIAWEGFCAFALFSSKNHICMHLWHNWRHIKLTLPHCMLIVPDNAVQGTFGAVELVRMTEGTNWLPVPNFYLFRHNRCIITHEQSCEISASVLRICHLINILDIFE